MPEIIHIFPRIKRKNVFTDRTSLSMTLYNVIISPENDQF